MFQSNTIFSVNNPNKTNKTQNKFMKHILKATLRSCIFSNFFFFNWINQSEIRVHSIDPTMDFSGWKSHSILGTALESSGRLCTRIWGFLHMIKHTNAHRVIRNSHERDSQYLKLGASTILKSNFSLSKPGNEKSQLSISESLQAYECSPDWDC